MAAKQLKDYKDKNGFIMVLTKDGGDSLANISREAIAKFVEEPELRNINGHDFAEKFTMCMRWYDTKKVKDGQAIVAPEWARHWNDLYWYGQSQTMSEDNFELAVNALGLYAPYSDICKNRFNHAMIALIKRGGFTWNWKHIWPGETDHPKIPDNMPFWDLIADYIRGNRMWYLYLILLVMDLGIVISSVFRVLTALVQTNNTSSCLNHQSRIILKCLVYPTPVNWIAKLIYSFRRKPKVAKVDIENNGEPAKDSSSYLVWFTYFWRPQDPPMFQVMQASITRYLNPIPFYGWFV